MSHPNWFRAAKHVFVAAAGVFLEKKTDRALTFDGAKLPKWFDVAKHALVATGIIERETGIHLAADGLPAHGLRRALALAADGQLTDALAIVADEAIEAAVRQLAAVQATEAAPIADIAEDDDEADDEAAVLELGVGHHAMTAIAEPRSDGSDLSGQSAAQIQEA